VELISKHKVNGFIHVNCVLLFEFYARPERVDKWEILLNVGLWETPFACKERDGELDVE
jgi:hypothetical protein